MPPVNSDIVPQLLKLTSSCTELTLHDGGYTETGGSVHSEPWSPNAPQGLQAGAAAVMNAAE